jgi:hypothetical protein
MELQENIIDILQKENALLKVEIETRDRYINSIKSLYEDACERCKDISKYSNTIYELHVELHAMDKALSRRSVELADKDKQIDILKHIINDLKNKET